VKSYWRAAALVVIVAAAILEIYGFWSVRPWTQNVWEPPGPEHFRRYCGWFLTLAIPILLMAPWLFAGFMAALVIVLTMVSVGPAAVLSVVFFLASSCALGLLLLGRSQKRSLELMLCATVLGVASYIFLMTLIARLTMHYRASWGFLLVLPIALLWRRGGDLWRPFHVPGGSRPVSALLAFVLGMHWLVVLEPEKGTDGLAMHLAVATNIARHHRFTFEPGLYVWSVMPMGGDWGNAIVYLFGGEFASRLLNFSLFLLALGLLYTMLRRWAGPDLSLFLVALFATTPLVQMVTGSLFIENTQMALLMAVVVAIWRLGETGDRRWLFAAAALAGTSLAVKYGALSFVVIAAPFLMWEIRRIPTVASALALVIFTVTAAPTYLIAWRKTGNPIYPFLNEKIHSPLLDPTALFQDNTFREPIAPTTPYDITFHTTKFWEAQNGSFGFQYLFLIPLALLGAAGARDRRVLSAVTIVLIGSIAVFKVTPNGRYIYAVLPLLAVPFAALSAYLNSRLFNWTAGLALTACALVNIYFIPASGWYHKDFYARAPFSPKSKQRYIRETVPVRDAVMHLNRAHPGAPVLLVNDNDIADVEADAFENNWHQFWTVIDMRNAPGVPQALALLHKWRIQYFIARKPNATEKTDPETLGKILAACAVPEYEVGDYYLSRFDPACQPGRPEFAFPPGLYDDFDPSLWWRGEWKHDTAFDKPVFHTVTYSADTGAEVRFAFEGKALRWVFTRAHNRGIAEIAIDGASQGTVDLYSPDVIWQSQQRFCCFAPGRHQAMIRVLGQHSPGSSGQYVDVDAIFVE
jgi:hypothetical protein